MLKFLSGTQPEDIKSRNLIFNQKGEYESPLEREEESYLTNKIRTSKYTLLTFLPINLFEQIIRPANFYFCFIAVLQSIPEVSISGGTPTILLPLMFVFSVTALKDALEDLKRHRDDTAENERLIEVVQKDATFKKVECELLNVGDIVRIHDRQRFPADLLMITSAKGQKAPYCYVETSNIDGETNLKLKQSPEGLNSLPSFDNLNCESGSLNIMLHESNVVQKSFREFEKRMASTTFDCDSPNGQLDTWAGMLKNIHIPIIINNNDLNNDEEKNSLDLFVDDFENLEYDTRNVKATIDNFLLRGSELRNSDWIYGLVIYTGFDCKIFMNNKSREAQRMKRSSVEKRLNKFIYIMAMSQFVICILCSILSYVWLNNNSDAWYLDYSIDAVLGAFYKFFTWFIIFAQFIPISLLVSMEIVKFLQAQFMQWDISMYSLIHGEQDKFCAVQSSNLNEELGQIEFVFSDKTGTLTDNSLDFRKCVIGNENYGRGETEIGRAAKRREEELQMKLAKQNVDLVDDDDIKDDDERDERSAKIVRSYTSDVDAVAANCAPHVNFDEQDRLRNLLSQSQSQTQTSQQAFLVRQFLTVLALNNSCYPVFDDTTQSLTIRASSPDDECLTCFAQFIGIQLTSRQPPIIKLDIFGDINQPSKSKCEEWEILAELEFTSKRKRMTSICRNRETNRIYFTMKGADSEMAKFIKNGYKNHQYYNTTEKYLNQYSGQGLRTLVIGCAILPNEWWEDVWCAKYEKFLEDTLINEQSEHGHLKGSCSNDCRKCQFYDILESSADIELLGVTAIEDKLQESVPETISALLDGGVNVWILTGDKQKTAENIGIACNLLEPSMERAGLLFKLVTPDAQTLHTIMTDALEKIAVNLDPNQNAGMVINSKALNTIMEEALSDNSDLQDLFLQLSLKCKSVIGVRLQPNQKAQIIKFIQSNLRVITLAIGDGANDEPMIKVANVGVGIAGLEGTAAVRASDYAIAKFKFLKILMFIHGRLHYRRITTLVCYMFYKNGLLSLSSFWFGMYNGFSGQQMYLEWAYQLYNVVFTAMPIFYYSIFDRDYNDEYLKQHPELYQISQSGSLFTPRIFFTWIADSLLASFLLVFVPLNCYAYMTSPDNSGQSAGLWTTGVACLTSIVFTANFRLAFITCTWTWISHVFLWGSILAYFLCMIIFSASTIWAKAGSDYYWLMFRSMATWRFWLVTLVATVISLFIPFTIIAFRELRKVTSVAEVVAPSSNSISLIASKGSTIKKKK